MKQQSFGLPMLFLVGGGLLRLKLELEDRFDVARKSREQELQGVSEER